MYAGVQTVYDIYILLRTIASILSHASASPIRGWGHQRAKIWASLLFTGYRHTPRELEEIGCIRHYIIPCAEQAFEELEDDHIEAFKVLKGECDQRTPRQSKIPTRMTRNERGEYLAFHRSYIQSFLRCITLLLPMAQPSSAISLQASPQREGSQKITKVP